MPNLEDTYQGQPAKIIVMAHSGSGKSGALAALANEGYKLRILDFDNGLDPLRTYVKPEYRKNVSYVTLQDVLDNSTGETMIKQATAFAGAMRLLTNWADGPLSLGAPSTWGLDEVLVLDSLTFAATSALHLASVRNKQLTYRPKAVSGAGDPRQIIGEAQILVEGMLANLFSISIKCNVIVNAHVTYEGPETDPTGFPTSVGRKLSPIIPRFFNTLLFIEKQPPNNRVIRQAFPGIPTKCPVVVPDNLPLDTGLATVVKAITKQPTPKERSK